MAQRAWHVSKPGACSRRQRAGWTSWQETRAAEPREVKAKAETFVRSRAGASVVATGEAVAGPDVIARTKCGDVRRKVETRIARSAGENEPAGVPARRPEFVHNAEAGGTSITRGEHDRSTWAARAVGEIYLGQDRLDN